MPKVFTSESQKRGEIGENIAAKFLVKQGFEILDRNYTKKWGEIDIVAEKDGHLHFFEVKSVSVQASTSHTLERGGQDLDNYRAEDNMHPWKLQRLGRTVQTYLLSERVPDYKEWQVDLVIVFLDIQHKKARLKIVKDIVL